MFQFYLFRMKIHYIILVHKNPEQLCRLVEQLETEQTDFYIQVDRKTEISPFQEKLSRPNVCFISERVDILWGTISQVSAVLNCMREISRKGEEGHVILLSGQDYPLKSNRYIAAFLETHRTTDYLFHFSLPSDIWPRKGLDRLEAYRIGLSKTEGKKQVKIEPCAFTLRNFYHFLVLLCHKPAMLPKAIRFFFTKRKHPSGIKPFGGSFWWGLKLSSVNYILDYLETHPAYWKYHQYTANPDEIMFPSILCSAPEIAKNIWNSDLRYIDWGEGKESPRIFTVKDWETLIRQSELREDFLFARKFDLEVDSVLLDQIEERRRETES